MYSNAWLYGCLRFVLFELKFPVSSDTDHHQLRSNPGIYLIGTIIAAVAAEVRVIVW